MVRRLSGGGGCFRLSDGDRIEWLYSLELGRDLPGYTAGAALWAPSLPAVCPRPGKLRQHRTILTAQICRQIFRQTNQIDAGNSGSIVKEICAVWRKRCKKLCGQGASRELRGVALNVSSASIPPVGSSPTETSEPSVLTCMRISPPE